MVNDQEPRYRLVDADGNVVGSLFAESDGTLKLQEGTSGSDNELALSAQGALEINRVSVNDTLIDTGLAFAISSGVPQSDPADTSSSSFETIASMDGAVPTLQGVPAGATLQANLFVKANSVPSNETGTYRVTVLSLDVGGGAAVDPLTSVAVDVTDTATSTSGWKSIESDISASDRAIRVSSLNAKVTGGTLSSAKKERFLILFRWVVD